MKDCTSKAGHAWSDETEQEVEVPYAKEAIWRTYVHQPVVTKQGTSFVYCVHCRVDGYRMAAS